MARIFFGRVLAIAVFAFAIIIVGEWVTRDRPTAWLARLAGDEAAAVAGASHVSAPPVDSPAPPVPEPTHGLTTAASARGARVARRPAAR